MQNKIKNIIITIGFVIILFAIFITNIIVKDKEISVSEKRRLAQFSTITNKLMYKRDIKDDWEKYVEDQFVGRDFFRGIKAFFSINIFTQKDYNKLFKKEEAIYKMTYPLNVNNIQKSTQKIKYVYDKYLQGMNVYYAIIPDKNYFLENDDHLKIDYDKLQQTMENELHELNYIDIREGLTLESYYRTDMHWRQENIQEAVKVLQENMGLETINVEYELQDRGLFYGSYYGQYATNVKPDTLYTLTNDTINNCTAYDVDEKRDITIYTNLDSIDKYDTFLEGPNPLIDIENPNAQTDKELLLFRDSFGSSLAPLLLENYRKITLIDLRYISREILSDYIEFKNQDVLFLYNNLVLNNNTFL